MFILPPTLKVTTPAVPSSKLRVPDCMLKSPPMLMVGVVAVAVFNSKALFEVAAYVKSPLIVVNVPAIPKAKKFPLLHVKFQNDCPNPFGAPKVAPLTLQVELISQ